MMGRFQSPEGYGERFPWLIAWLLALVPPAVVSVLIWLYGVDVPVLDQWSMVEDIEKFMSGTWGIQDLLRSHNGHRMMMARLILVPLAALSGWNTRLEMAVGVVFATAMFIVYARALTDRSIRAEMRKAPWLIPLASVAVFSLNQWENWLWGIQAFEFMTVFWVVAGLWILSARNLSARLLAVSIACGIAASFCKAAGLVVWPAGLAILLFGPRPSRTDLARWSATWTAAATGVIVLFFTRLPGDVVGPRVSLSDVASQPLAFAYFTLTVLGAPVTSFLGSAWPPKDAGFGFAAGVVSIFLFAGLAVALVRRGRRPNRVEVFFFGLCLFSIGVATQIGIARFTLGAPQAMASRFITHTMPFWIGMAILLSIVPSGNRERTSRRRWRVRAEHAGVASIALLLVVGSARALPEFQSRFDVLTPSRASLGSKQEPDLMIRLHPETNQVYGNLGVLQNRRLSVFRSLPRFAAPPAETRPLENFGQFLVVKGPLPRVVASSEFELTIRVTNPTCETWPRTGDHTGAYAVHLSNQWRNLDGKIVVRDGLRSLLPDEMEPGESVEVVARMKAPPKPGRYLLMVSMVQESVAWFTDRKTAPLTIRVEVTSPG